VSGKATGDGRQGGRFSRSGHTSHQPVAHPSPPVAPPPQPTPPVDDFDRPTYHRSQAAATGDKRTPARALASGSNQLARSVTRKVITASKANGADESGLTHLIWNQVLSYGTDAMITVALAGTVFFGASADAKRGNVLLYLLVTMAPFALIAPVIGPLLDRLQHGRRWAMGATAIGRAVLALIMAAHPTNLLVLYPCALGSLVLSKAYSVVRAAAAPRLVPAGMTLVEANARLSIFGLGSALIAGGLVAAVIKVSGSYTAGLVFTAIGFAVCAFFAFRLPKQVDSANPARRRPEELPRPATQPRVPPLQRIRLWAKRGLAPEVVTSLQGESTLRFLSGFLTIFLAFFIEATEHGFAAVLALGGLAGGAGLGNFTGTAIGTRLRLPRPELIVVIGAATASAICLLTALLFNIWIAIIGTFLVMAINALGKIALDSVIQRDVTETLRASAFGRSETFLQLSWVLGATVGVALPAHEGSLGFWVAGGTVAAATAVVALHGRAMIRAVSHAPRPHPPGAVAPGQPQQP
jgi:MFS family permease